MFDSPTTLFNPTLDTAPKNLFLFIFHRKLTLKIVEKKITDKFLELGVNEDKYVIIAAYYDEKNKYLEIFKKKSCDFLKDPTYEIPGFLEILNHASSNLKTDLLLIEANLGESSGEIITAATLTLIAGTEPKTIALVAGAQCYASMADFKNQHTNSLISIIESSNSKELNKFLDNFFDILKLNEEKHVPNKVNQLGNAEATLTQGLKQKDEPSESLCSRFNHYLYDTLILFCLRGSRRGEDLRKIRPQDT